MTIAKWSYQCISFIDTQRFTLKCA